MWTVCIFTVAPAIKVLQHRATVKIVYTNAPLWIAASIWKAHRCDHNFALENPFVIFIWNCPDRIGACRCPLPIPHWTHSIAVRIHRWAPHLHKTPLPIVFHYQLTRHWIQTVMAAPAVIWAMCRCYRRFGKWILPCVSICVDEIVGRGNVKQMTILYHTFIHFSIKLLINEWFRNNPHPMNAVFLSFNCY